MSLIQRYDISFKQAVLLSRKNGFIMPEDYRIITDYILGDNKVSILSMDITELNLDKHLNKFLKDKLNTSILELTDLIFSWHYYLNVIEGHNFNLNHIQNEAERKKACLLLKLAGKDIQYDTTFMQVAFADIIIKVVTSTNSDEYSYETFINNTSKDIIKYKPNKKD